MIFDSPEEEAEFLMQMCTIYPGDPDGSIMKYVCEELLNIPYKPVEVLISYEEGIL